MPNDLQPQLMRFIYITPDGSRDCIHIAAYGWNDANRYLREYLETVASFFPPWEAWCKNGGSPDTLSVAHIPVHRPAGFMALTTIPTCALPA
jgi:hypothetical protein